jgi:DnaK suppressor protein
MESEAARAHLEAERTRLLGVRDSFDGEHLHDETESQSIGELSGVDQHQADLGTETFEREKDMSILEQVESELHDVEVALRRLDEGTYGRCEACGKPIDEARLDALPAARLCLADQQAAEREIRR